MNSYFYIFFMRKNALFAVITITFLLLISVLSAEAQGTSSMIQYGSRGFFVNGHYYNLMGQKVEGLILLRNGDFKRFSFKYNKTSRVEKFTPEMVTSFVLERDSFAVSHDKAPKFYQVILDDEIKIFGLIEMKGTILKSGLGGSTGEWIVSGVRNYEEGVFFYGPDADHLTKITPKNYIEVLTKILADQEYITEKFKTKQYIFEDMVQIFIDYKLARLKN